MGTSKAYGGLKGNPNWGPLSAAVSHSISDGHPSQKSLGLVMSRLVSHLGGSNSALMGGSSIGGRAGIKTARQFGTFIGNIRRNGFSEAINFLSNGTEIHDADQGINIILEKCTETASLLDDVAAKAAMRDTLEDIGAGAETLEELGDRFEEVIKDYGGEELLVRYFAFYLFEHLSTDFYEKLIKEKGIRETDLFYKDLKEYILEHTKTVSKHRDLLHVDWHTDYGKNLMQEIYYDTLKAFEGYES